jgi:hypothetical protein
MSELEAVIYQYLNDKSIDELITEINVIIENYKMEAGILNSCDIKPIKPFKGFIFKDKK